MKKRTDVDRLREFMRVLKARLVSVSGPGARDLVKQLALPYEVEVTDESAAR